MDVRNTKKIHNKYVIKLLPENWISTAVKRISLLYMNRFELTAHYSTKINSHLWKENGFYRDIIKNAVMHYTRLYSDQTRACVSVSDGSLILHVNT